MLKKTLYVLAAIIALLVIGFITQLKGDIPLDKLKADLAQPPSKFIRIDGMDVHYRDEGAGYPVVLVHGMSSSLHTWEDWTKVLSKKYRVVRMDLPGYGLTGPNANNDYSAAYYVKFMQEFLDSMGIKDCYMAGNSLGGFITWNYAAAHPEQVKKIILIDAAGYPFKRPPMMAALAGNKLITWLAPKLSSRFIVNASMRQVYGDPSKITDSVAERYYELSMRAGNRASFMAFINHFREVDTNAIKTIKAPTLIMWGEKDRWIPLVDAEKFHRDIAGSQVITYPGVGHIPMEEDANQTVADALHFFDTVNDSTLAVQ